MKRLSIILLTLIILFLTETQEAKACWGTLYPSLAFFAVEEDNNETKISSIDTNYKYIKKDNEKVQIKIAIVEWFKKVFNF